MFILFAAIVGVLCGAVYFSHRSIEEYFGEYEWLIAIMVVSCVFVTVVCFYYILRAALRLENDRIVKNYILVKRPVKKTEKPEVAKKPRRSKNDRDVEKDEAPVFSTVDAEEGKVPPEARI